MAITGSNSTPSGDGETVNLGMVSEHCRQNVRKLTVLTQNLISPVSVAPNRCNEVYETLLSPKGRGFALWIPEPNKNLPVPYQRTGIQIGDVGIIRPDGSFSFIFNICVPRDNPINPRSLPEDFVPIHPPIDPIDIHTVDAFNPGSYLASTSIEKSEDDTSFP